jgi:ABC-2 type transport system permease protein
MSPGEPQKARTADASTARSVAGGRLLRSEVLLLFRRRRTVGLLAALVAIPVLIAVALELTSTPPAPGDGPPFIDQVTQSGVFVAATSLVVAIPLFLPLTVAVVAGDSIAGEAGQGTLRYLLLAPAGRTRLLAVKSTVVLAFCLVAPAVMAGAGMLLGSVLFGVGDAASLSGERLDTSDLVARIGLLTLFVGIAMMGLACIGVFVSTLTDVPVGAMAATIIVAIASQILGGLSQLDWLHPWLPTYTWLEFADLLRSPIVWDSFRDNLALQAGYAAVFLSLAWARLTTKDVLS